MYESYWGLVESPFINRCNQRWFYESPTHEEALARMYFLVEESRRCGVLRGPRGTGKSLLLKVLEEQLHRTQRQSAHIDLTGLDSAEFLGELCLKLQFPTPRDDSPALAWRALADFLVGSRLAHVHTVIMLDHLELAGEGIEQAIARLLQLERGAAESLTVIIATGEQVNSGARPAWLDECDLMIDLVALDQQQTEQYVRETLRRAGCTQDIFEPAAVNALFQRSAGVPREVNRLCDLALLTAMGQQAERIGPEVIDTAGRELVLQ